jgi:myo-inositol 2-dehydrogenase/D-chiro-inositol 1-dehydrogenase
MREVLTSGRLGYATLLHCRHRNPSVPENYTTRNMIDDTAIHEIDISRFLLGEEIAKVRVDTPRATSRRFEHLHDPLVLVATTESGVLIDDEVNVNIQFGYSIECELVLEAGTVRLGDQEHTYLRDESGNRNAICSSHIDRFHDAFNQEVQQWIRAIERDEHAGSTAWDGYAATVVVDAAIESLENGGREVGVAMIEKPAFYA